jgi:hypothetical protein
MALLHLGTLCSKKLLGVESLTHCFFKQFRQGFAASDPAAFK